VDLYLRPSIFIHLAVCLTTSPKPLPNRALHKVRSRASSFKCEYPLLSLRSSSSFLRFLPYTFFLCTGQFYICLLYSVVELSGHSCRLAALALGNLPLNLSNKRLFGPQTSGRFARETDHLNLPRNKPRFIGRQFHRQDSVSQ